MAALTPSEIYNAKCQEGIIVKDPQQSHVIQKLDVIYNQLVKENQERMGLLKYFRKPHLIKGLYLWGGVGIGKTFLMDCFYQSLPFANKKRMHFHAFMRYIHNELTKLQGHKNPLENVAENIAKEALVLCFDEFFVSDITDAMLLGKLFKALFDYSVCIVATSNIPPDLLYKNGLQRSQFLPAIALIKSHTEVIHLSSQVDYRLRHLKEAGVFYTPLNAESQQKMEKSFTMLTESEEVFYTPINILSRPIRVLKRTNKIVWFDFNDICCVPRSQQDYLAIADQFNTVFISNIPIISPQEKDIICLFISLVDVFYDARVRLVFSADEAVEKIYERGYMVLEYTRTHSRLKEMQSIDYFSGEF